MSWACKPAYGKDREELNQTVKSKETGHDYVRPNCAVVGVWGAREASTLTYLALYALQHRGQEATGIVSSDGRRLHSQVSQGLVADVYSREVLHRLPGTSAIGHNRYSTTGSSTADNVQPILVRDRSGPIAISHNGNLTNYAELRRFLEDEGSLFRTSSDTELILQLVARSHGETLQQRILEALRLVKGAYSLTLLTRDHMVAVRDPYGFRPLCLGKLRSGWIVASESCALDILGAKYVRDIEPGELLIFNEAGIQNLRFADSPRRAHCIFEFVYFSRPDSRIFGDNVDKARRRLGHNLARWHPAKDVDYIISVPDSSNTAALGYAHESGKPFEIALIRNHYVGRTFIEPEQRMRDFGVKIKFNPVAGVIKGKRVVMVEDSIVRGTTLRKLVRLLRKAGAKEVHVRVSSPPIRFPCFYGMDFPTRRELMAAWHSVEEIRRFIRADSLEYLTPQELLDAVPHSAGQDYCTACFTGDYPIPVPDFEGKDEPDKTK